MEMKEILSKMTNHEDLTREETKEIMINITERAYSNEQIAALLMAIQMRGIKVDELLGFRDGLMETGKKVDFDGEKVIDIVGTGGDGKNSFNISTTSCFVVAGAGYKVAKHGNYAATSVSGAGNVLEELGAKFSSDPEQLKETLDTCGFVYMHAPLFAYGMKFVGPIRRALQIPTCFNLLGPLVNPCCPQAQLLGVANLNQMRLYGQVYEKMGIDYGIVNSIDGYDEISLTSDFKVKTKEMERVFSPSELGFNRLFAQEELFGGKTKEEAKQILINVLKNEGTEAQMGAVLANSAFAIHIMSPKKGIAECLDIARISLESGYALKAMQSYIDFTQEQ
jgi:anthranilate phosphoribosyltransferase